MLILLGSMLSASTSPATSETTIYVAKKIITMASPEAATAVAVRDKFIISVGNLEDVKASLGNQAFTVDEVFKDKIIMPGLIDNHLHPAMAALILPMKFITPFDWRFPDREVAAVQGEKPYRQALKDGVAKSNKDSRFLTWGYHQYFHGDMSRSFLDSISIDQPIIV